MDRKYFNDKMQIIDRIYGKIEVKTPIITELIKSKPFQRLKKISQDGAPHFIQPVRTGTRYEHSIGVWYLAYKYNRPIEEQIASLLHDVPHTAFSHVIDFVMKDEKHEFHEKFTEKIILESEIPQILKRHKVDLKKVLNKENFELLDNSLPDISFDRLDYFLRDGFAIGFITQDLINDFLNGLYEKNKTFYFKDPKLAALFSILFVSFSRLIWLDPNSHGSFFLLSSAVKIAIDKKYITEQDFFTDDEILMKKLTKINDSEINKLLNRLRPNLEFEYADENSAEFYGANKPRSVDPLVKTKKGLQRISKLAPNLGYYFKEFNQKYKYLGVNQLL